MGKKAVKKDQPWASKGGAPHKQYAHKMGVNPHEALTPEQKLYKAPSLKELLPLKITDLTLFGTGTMEKFKKLYGQINPQQLPKVTADGVPIPSVWGKIPAPSMVTHDSAVYGVDLSAAEKLSTEDMMEELKKAYTSDDWWSEATPAVAEPEPIVMIDMESVGDPFAKFLRE